MNTTTCNGCGGVYDMVQADGGLYFHACPVIILAAAARNENLKSATDRSPIAAGAGIQPGRVIVAPQRAAPFVSPTVLG